jgi:hypothetical protein
MSNPSCETIPLNFSPWHSALKMVILTSMSTAFLAVVHLCAFSLFDNQDFLLQSHDGY